MSKTKFIAAGLVTAALMAGATPASATPATTSATWDASCSIAVAIANKDISNIVYRVDGVDTKIEFVDGTKVFLVDGSASDIWIKSGNNKSGDGPGYGEHFVRPDNCAVTTSVVYGHSDDAVLGSFI